MASKKRLSLRKDVNELAFETVRAMLGEGPKPLPPGEREKNPEAVKRGRKGGKRRKSSLSPEQRSAIAKKAAEKRWEKR
jgi:hypothetical protein